MSMSMADKEGQQFGGVTGSVPVADGPTVMLAFQDSTYGAGSSAPTGKMTGSALPTTSDDSFSTPMPGQGQRPSDNPAPSRWNFITVAFYRPYFDVDTIDVLERIRDSLLPFPRTNFLEKTALNPDMYGPFWICTTLIFATAALGNISGFLSYKASGESKWTYDINKVTWAATIFYGYAGIVPAGLFFLLRYMNVSTGLVHLWCLYGYSLFVFIPTSFLSVVPVELLRWVFVAFATAISAAFLGTNLKAQINVGTDKWLPVVIGAVALQCLLGLVLKLYFFTYFRSSASITL